MECPRFVHTSPKSAAVYFLNALPDGVGDDGPMRRRYDKSFVCGDIADRVVFVRKARGAVLRQRPDVRFIFKNIGNRFGGPEPEIAAFGLLPVQAGIVRRGVGDPLVRQRPCDRARGISLQS